MQCKCYYRSIRVPTEKFEFEDDADSLCRVSISFLAKVLQYLFIMAPKTLDFSEEFSVSMINREKESEREKLKV